MASPPFNIAETVPADDGIVSQFPGTERTFRDVVESWILINHDTNGNHDRVALIDKTAATPAGAAALVTIWQEGGVLKGRNTTGTIRNLFDFTTALFDNTFIAALPNASLANMAQSTVKGRAAAAGTGLPVDLTATQTTAILDAFVGDSGAGGTKGLVPAPAAGDATAGAIKALLASGSFGFTGPPHFVIQDQKTSGTDGGTATSGADQTRTLNTEVYDLAGMVSISANVFTLQAGTYVIKWAAPAHKVTGHQSWLRNDTDATVVGRGRSAYTDNASNYATTESQGIALVTIASAKGFKIMHRVGSTQTTTGFGVAGGFGTEVYTTVEGWKVG